MAQKKTLTLSFPKEAISILQRFAQRFTTVQDSPSFPFITNGLFGHITYDSVAYFEDITIQPSSPETAIDQIMYQVYRYVIAINHFKDELYIFEHSYGNESQ